MEQHTFWNTRVAAHFVQLSAIPRGSGNEKAASDHIVAFARERGLAHRRDERGNVLVKKPASPGREEHAPVLLQCHLDMVCEKDPGSAHDFFRDPIRPVERDGFLTAEGTTLGADNGIGAAYILAMLEEGSLSHPPMEAAFTTGEEVGMTGMAGLDVSWLEAERMINLDGEEQGVLYASCAGGARFHLTAPLSLRVAEDGATPCRLILEGLRGGHSGLDIHRGRANAIVLLCRVMEALAAKGGVQVSALFGGGKANAIPREARAELWLRPETLTPARRIVEEFQTALTGEYGGKEPGLSLRLEVGGKASSRKVCNDRSLQQILSAVLLTPDGLLHFSAELEGVADASSNLGVLEQGEDRMRISGLIRSNTNSRIRDAVGRLRRLARALDLSLEIERGYSAWEYRRNSPLRDLCRRVYRDRFGAEMAVASIHGGLECALMAEKRPVIDMVSLGPSLLDVHTTRERVEIASLLHTWRYLTALLQAM